MKQKTVLQEIIEKLLADSKYLNGENDHREDKIVGQYLKTIADDLQENYLKKEQEQIMLAYFEGVDKAVNDDAVSPQEYFNQTYTQ